VDSPTDFPSRSDLSQTWKAVRQIADHIKHGFYSSCQLEPQAEGFPTGFAMRQRSSARGYESLPWLRSPGSPRFGYSRNSPWRSTTRAQDWKALEAIDWSFLVLPLSVIHVVKRELSYALIQKRYDDQNYSGCAWPIVESRALSLDFGNFQMIKIPVGFCRLAKIIAHLGVGPLHAVSSVRNDRTHAR